MQLPVERAEELAAAVAALRADLLARRSIRVAVPAQLAASMSAALEAAPEPDLSEKSTPTGGGCHMKQASIFTEMLPKFCRNFTNVHSFPQISDNFD